MKLALALAMALIMAVALAGTVQAQGCAIKLTPAKESFRTGEIAQINGVATCRYWTAIQVNNPKGTPFYVDQVKPGLDGKFTIRFWLPKNAVLGQYTIYAQQSYMARSANTKFLVRR